MPRGRPDPVYDCRRRLCIIAGDLWVRLPTTIVQYSPATDSRPQDHQEDMNPLMGFALAHPEQPPLHHLKGVRLQVDEDKEQTIPGVGNGQFV
jgi:hypothetical protein